MDPEARERRSLARRARLGLFLIWCILAGAWWYAEPEKSFIVSLLVIVVVALPAMVLQRRKII